MQKINHHPWPFTKNMPSNNETLLRQWAMLRMVPRYPQKITARDLTDRLEGEGFPVSKRTIERDLMELSAAFPLALDDREKPYGWSWQKDAPAFDLPGLGDHESLMLLMVEQHLQAMLPPSTLDVMAPYFKAARMRLASGAKNGKAKMWAEKIRAVPPTQPLLAPKVDADVQRIVSDALLNEKQLQVSYRKRGEKKSIDYRLHPLALVQRGPVFYLCVRLFDYEDVRLLALHRIKTAELLDEPAATPPEFDLDAAIASGLMGFGSGRIISLLVKFTKEKGEHLFETPLSQDQEIVELKDGNLLVLAKVAETPQLIWWLRALGEGVEVMEPAHLLEENQAPAEPQNELLVIAKFLAAKQQGMSNN